MITLQLINQHETPFTDYPQLKDIWPTNFQDLAESITNDELAIGPNDGPILLILADGEVVGITGAYTTVENAFVMGLRWTGVIRSHRKQGIAKEAISLLIAYLTEHDWACNELVELLPANEYGDSMKPFFEKMGFTPKGVPTYYEWLGCEGQEYILRIAQ